MIVVVLMFIFFRPCQSTPCHIALREDIEKCLVDHGADVNMKDGVSASAYICLILVH